MENVLFDLLNALCIALLILWISKVYKLSTNITILFFVHLIAIFLLNDVMFPKEYFGDQMRYLDVAKATREALAFFPTDEFSPTINVTGTFFALYPILTINTVYSLAMINFTLFIFLFVYLKNRGVLQGQVVYFYLLYPSLILYSSLALRDMLIFVLMALSVYWGFVRHSMLMSIAWSLPLIVIKPVNFFILTMTYLLVSMFSKSWMVKLVSWSIFVIFVGILSQYVTLDEVNRYKLAMLVEDGGDALNYVVLVSWTDVVMTGVQGIIAFLLRPFPWEVRNPMQLLQFFENIVVFWIVVKAISSSRKDLIKDRFLLFLNSLLFVGLGIYGLIVSNFGTAARYKFPFIAVYIIFYLAHLVYKKNKNSQMMP